MHVSHSWLASCVHTCLHDMRDYDACWDNLSDEVNNTSISWHAVRFASQNNTASSLLCGWRRHLHVRLGICNKLGIIGIPFRLNTIVIQKHSSSSHCIDLAHRQMFTQIRWTTRLWTMFAFDVFNRFSGDRPVIDFGASGASKFRYFCPFVLGHQRFQTLFGCAQISIGSRQLDWKIRCHCQWTRPKQRWSKSLKELYFECRNCAWCSTWCSTWHMMLLHASLQVVTSIGEARNVDHLPSQSDTRLDAFPNCPTSIWLG